LYGEIRVFSCYRLLREGTVFIIAGNCVLPGDYSKQLYTPTQMVAQHKFIFKLSNAKAQFNLGYKFCNDSLKL